MRFDAVISHTIDTGTPEVWPGPGSYTARRSSLARRPWPGVLQAGSVSSYNRCLNGRAPPYLSDCAGSPVLSLGCIRVLPTVSYLQYLATVSTLTAVVPFQSPGGPTVCNSLPDFIRDPTISAECFRRLFKTYLFTRY